jgi:flagellar biogenesis protein FliO
MPEPGSAAAVATATPSPPSGDYGGLLLTSLLVLVIVVAIVLVQLSRRWGLAGRPPDPELLAVVARISLEPRRSLYVVDVAGKALLVGTSEMGVALLAELDRAAVMARAQPKRGFGDLVRAAMERRRGPAAAGAEASAPPASTDEAAS